MAVQLDHNIYLQKKPVDIVGSVYNGLKLRDMIDTRNNEKEKQNKDKLRDKAYQAGIVTNPDGSQSVDRKRTLSELAKVGGQEYFDAKSKFEQMDQQEAVAQHTKNLQDFDLVSRSVYGANDQTTWEKSLDSLKAQGIDVSKIDRNFSPQTRNQVVGMALTAKEKIDNELKRYEIGSKYAEAQAKREDAKTKGGEMKIAQAKQLGTYQMGKKAEEQYQAATADANDYDPTGAGQFIDNDSTGWVPNIFKNKKAVEANSAQSAWVESYLRDASGAAIAPSERMAYAKDFFPRPGDSEQVIQNKAELRRQKMENALVASGNDPNDPQYAIATPKKKEQKKTDSIGMNTANAAGAPKVLKTKDIEW